MKVRPVDLETLGEVSEGNSAIKCGDWLYRISQSKRSTEFWTKSIEVVQERYQEHLKATPIQKLIMEFEAQDIEVNKDYEKLRSVVTEMLLKALPKSLAAEAITKRLDNPLKILLMILIKYQPGGRKEKEAILHQITNPEVCWNEEKTLEEIRTWNRRIARAKELKLVIPDPSVLLSALDNMTEKVLKKDARKVFRIESLREQIKVDVTPSYKAVEDLTTFIEAELEEASNSTPNPKVKALFTEKDEKKGKGGEGKGQFKGDSKGQKGKDDSKGKGKKGKSEPCRYFAFEEGCRFGQTCKSYHRTLKPEEG